MGRDGSSLETNVAAALGVSGNALQLTGDGVANTRSLYEIPTLGEPAATGFTAKFDYALSGGGDRPADGFSFNIGPAIPVEEASEEGAGTGLSVEFDTWDNDGEGADNGIGIDVNVDGAAVAGGVMRAPAGNTRNMGPHHSGAYVPTGA